MRVAAAVVLILLLTSAVLFCGLSRQSYRIQDREAISAPVSRTHPVGTDELGRDRASRVAVALLLGLVGACASSAVATSIAIALGACSAAAGGWWSRSMLYAGDLFLTLPWLFLLMLVRAALPLNLTPIASETVTFLLLALLGVPAFLRMNHERMTRLLRADWLLQARTSGLRPNQLAQQFWPHLRPLLWVQFLLYVPACMLAEANLGAMGLGVSEPLPSLGNFLGHLQETALTGASPLSYLPVLLLIVALVALEMTAFGAKS